MPLHHYLPATFLGRFSIESGDDVRSRQIAALDLNSQRKAFNTAPKSVAGVTNLYTLKNHLGDPQVLEKNWQGYEGRLSSALDDLVQGRLSMNEWLRTLVPFVAGLFLRGPNFDSRYARRPTVSASSAANPDQLNHARIFEIQRLLAPVLAAEWKVARASGNACFVTCDKGFTPLEIQSGLFGVSIPIDRKHVLSVFPHWRRTIGRKIEGKWRPTIVRFSLDDDRDVISQNQSCARWAERFLFGGRVEDLEHLSEEDRTIVLDGDPRELGFPAPGVTSVHEYTWHRLISYFFDEDERKVQDGFPIDWMAVDAKDYWNPLMMIPIEDAPFISDAISVWSDQCWSAPRKVVH